MRILEVFKLKEKRALFSLVLLLTMLGWQSSQLHAQQLITNGDFELGLSNWTDTSDPSADNQLNTGSVIQTCGDGSWTSWASPRPPLAGSNSFMVDQTTFGSSTLISDVFTLPLACRNLKFSIDMEYESIVALNAGTQDIQIEVFDNSLSSLSSIFTLTGSGSFGVVQVPAANICIPMESVNHNYGSAALNSYRGDDIRIGIVQNYLDDCFVSQFDNVSLECEDPLTADDISVTDPCSCENPLNVTLADGTYLFQDFLHVSTVADWAVTLSANDGNFVDASNNPIPVGTLMTQVSPGEYELEFFTASGNSADIEISTGFGFVPFTAGGCELIDCCPSTLGCNDRVQISLGPDCLAEIRPNLILEDRMTDCDYSVNILDIDDRVVGSTTGTFGSKMFPEIDYTYVGVDWKAEVFYLNSSGVKITCWGWITVEDKIPPQIECIDDVLVGCQTPITDILTTGPLSSAVISDNCPGVELVIINDEFDENDCGPDGVTGIRKISYTAVDVGGKVADTCMFEIAYEALDLDDVEFPTNYDVECDTLSIALTPQVTGYPHIGGDELSDDNFCKLNITFSDDTSTVCGDIYLTTKVRRKWVVLDWCAGVYREGYQTISIKDPGPQTICEGPRGGAMGDFDVVAQSGCTTDFIFEPLDTTAATHVRVLGNQCSGDDIEFAVYYLRADERTENTVDLSSFTRAEELTGQRFRVRDLQLDSNWVRYYRIDECGNEKFVCAFEIYVTDGTPPVPICDEYTAVSLADNGWGRIYGASLDDGSYDACGGPVEFEVRRDSSSCDEALKDRADHYFGEYVQFCCEESGDTVPVELKVIDQGGAFNTCTVKVVVQDKHNDVRFNCPSVSPKTCAFLNDSNNATTAPTVEEFCGTVDSLFFRDNEDGLDAVCQTGIYERAWYAIVNGNEIYTGCTQEIEIIPVSIGAVSFLPATANAECDDYQTDLGLLPRIGGTPVDEYDDGCGNIGHTFKDDYFFNAEGFCVKVIRVWTVIDWCVYDPDVDLNAGKWQGTQIIYVSNNTGPEVSNCPEDLTVSSTGDACSGFASLSIPSARDLCFDQDIPLSGIRWTIDGPGIDTTNTGNIGTVELPAGVSTVSFEIFDNCGSPNVGDNACEYTVTVADTEKPTAYCRSLVATVITSTDPATGFPCTEIWASDFDLGSFDNCDMNLDVSFTDTLLTDTRRKFDCNQLGFQTLEIWFTDDSGNQDFCVASVNVQVNTDICDSIGSRPVLDIEGDVFTEENQMIEEVEVHLENMTLNDQAFNMTNGAGHFAFQNLSAYDDYRIEATSEQSYLNGVSTLDLVMIQRHILGIEKLATPYKVIAADINASEDINGLDLVELRKLILGIYTELPQNTSWKFIDESQNFSDVYNPWPLDETIELYKPSVDMMNNNFIGVKIGDVNGSVEMSAQGSIKGRDLKTVTLSNDILSLSNGNEYLIPIYLSQEVSLYGLQLELILESGVNLIGHEAGKLNVEDANIFVEGSKVLISYNQSTAANATPNEALFYLTVSSNSQLDNKVYTVGNTVLSSEVYNEHFEVLQIKHSENLLEEVVLYQNVPNPFSDMTLIEFELPKRSIVKLEVMDINGKVVKSYQNLYEKGRQGIEISFKDLSDSGVYYYKLETENFSATKKMIRVD